MKQEQAKKEIDLLPIAALILLVIGVVWMINSIAKINISVVGPIMIVVAVVLLVNHYKKK